MRKRVLIIFGVFGLLFTSSFAEMIGSLSLENFENPKFAQAISGMPSDKVFQVTTDRGCYLSLTNKEFVVSGNNAVRFEVTTSNIDPYRPPFFSFPVSVNDWTQYNSISFNLFVLPAYQFPEATILIQFHATDFDGTSWKNQNQMKSFAVKVPTGKPMQVMITLRNVRFKNKIGKVLVGVIRGKGSYYLDNFELQILGIRSEIAIIPSSFYLNKSIFIPNWFSIHLEQVPIKPPNAGKTNGFFDQDRFMYDSRLPVAVYFEFSKPVKKKIVKKITIATDTGKILKQIALTFEKSDMRISVPMQVRGNLKLKVKVDKQVIWFDLKDLTAISLENEIQQMQRQETKSPISHGIVSAYAGMVYKPDGTIDADAMLNRLKDLGVNGYTYLIWQKSESELAGLPDFCKKAADAGIEVWVYLVPPSESPIGRKEPIANRKYPPFDMDYHKWVEAIAKIAVSHPNLTMVLFDDFNGNLDHFTREYTKRMYELVKAIEPNLKLGYCVYHEALHDFVNAGYLPYTDALLWGYQSNYWLNPEAGISAASLPVEINDYYKALPNGVLIPCVYFVRHSSWPDDRPTLEYLAEAMKISYEQTGIAWVYKTPEYGARDYDLVKNFVQTLGLKKWENK